jgi:hypothetical protein
VEAVTEQQPPPEEPFDPYRFGRPDHPIPPEYAPPGYVPDPPPTPPTQPHPYYGPSQYASLPNPYAPYPPPGYPPYPVPEKASGMAVASMVLGIISVVGSVFAFLDAIPVVLAVVFGIIVLNAKRPGRGMAIAGIACGLVGAVLAIIVSVYVTSAVNKCGGFGNSDDPDFSACLQRHL